MRVRVYATLRPIVGGPEVDVELPKGATVQNLIELLSARWPDLREHLLTDDGGLSRRVNVFVGGRNVRWMDGAATSLAGVAEVDLFPPVAGG